MPFTVTMPKLSPTMEGGTIVKWCVKEGDKVEEGNVLIEVATDKATVEYSALDGGYLRKILVAEGEDAEVNQAIAVFTETKDESIQKYEPEGQSPKKEKEPEEDQQDEELAEEKPSKQRAGLAQPAFEPEPPLESYTHPHHGERLETRLKASPLARKIAREKGLDLSSVQGSGPGGRVVAKDLDFAQKETVVRFGSEQPAELPGSYEELKLSPMRRAIGERLQTSKTFIPHFYVQQEIDASALVALRDQLKVWNIKVTYNDCLVRACALALRTHPEINSGFNTVNNTIVRFKTIDIAIAVSVQDGLITPIVRHVDHLNISQISSQVKRLAQKAKNGKLLPEEYKGGSFTISNLGMYGINDFQAVINPPQSAILAVGGMIDKPIVKDGVIVAGKTMTLSLSSDHRVVDGADAARFLQTLRKLLENPAVLLV